MAKSKPPRRARAGPRLVPPPPKLPLIEPDTESFDLRESQLAVGLPVERMMFLLRFEFAERKLQSPAEVNKLLDNFSQEDFDRLIAKVRASDPRRHAQDLAYEAMLDAVNDSEAVALAKRAVELDPDCLDALMVLAECGNASPERFLAKVEDVAARGRRLFPPEYFQNLKDGVWQALELRPFLRALFRLGEGYRTLDNPNKGIAVLEELLALNPADQQRAREPLLSCYLAAERVEEAQDLLARFPKDRSAVFHWGRVLERYLSGDDPGAIRALKDADDQNPYVAGFMSMTRKPPAKLPEMYDPGDKNEAVHCFYILGTAWAVHPEAILWAMDIRTRGFK